MGCVNIQCTYNGRSLKSGEWMVWELGEEEPRRENSQGRGTSISVGSRKNEHTINCSLGKSTIIMC